MGVFCWGADVVDKSSASYKAGQIFGIIFLIVLAFLIIKKIIKK